MDFVQPEIDKIEFIGEAYCGMTVSPDDFENKSCVKDLGKIETVDINHVINGNHIRTIFYRKHEVRGSTLILTIDLGKTWS